MTTEEYYWTVTATPRNGMLVHAGYPPPPSPSCLSGGLNKFAGGPYTPGWRKARLEYHEHNTITPARANPDLPQSRVQNIK